MSPEPQAAKALEGGLELPRSTKYTNKSAVRSGQSFTSTFGRQQSNQLGAVTPTLQSDSSKKLNKVASRKDFLKVIEAAKDSTELVNEFRNRFAMKAQLKEDTANKLMIGISKYALPDTKSHRRNVAR